MVLGRLRKEQEMMGSQNPPSENLHDLISALAALLKEPGGAKQLITELHAASEDHKKAAAEARAEVEKQELHRDKTLSEIDRAATARNAAIDKHEADVTARLTAREKAVEAREKTVTARETEAEKLMAKAREEHKAIRRKVDAFDAA
jgi:hypothetical protein